MWIPRDAADVEAAARNGQLEETPSFDAKSELPTPKKNADIAIDVAAMATDGGVLLYGVAEDENKMPTIASPLALAGIDERIGQIVATSIAEVPYVDVRAYPLADDPTRGYVAVIVPQSARAPHQVIVGGDLRFYGRAAKGNRRLTEGDVARLYQRRQQWEQDRDELLAEAMRQAPYEPQDGLAYMHGFVRPVVPDRSIWERAAEAASGQDELRRLLAAAAARTKPSQGYDPNLRGSVNWRRQGADEWRMTSNVSREYGDPKSARYTIDVRINIDGRGHLFSGRVGEVIRHANEGPAPLILFESMLAGQLASFLAAMGELYRLGRYFGQVDIGFVATGLRGGVGSKSRDLFGFYDATYAADTYSRHERVAAAELKAPEDIARPLLRYLMEALTGRDFDPYAE